MIRHWLTTAWRSLIGNPLFSAITIISLSVGCCGAVLAGSNILQHLTFEQSNQDADRILVVTRKATGTAPITAPGQPMMVRVGGPPPTGPTVLIPMKDAIANADGIEAQTRLIYGAALTRADQDEASRRASLSQPALRTTAYVDADFFKVFPLPFLAGSAEGLQLPDTVILSEERAQALFPGQAAVGQTIEGAKGRTLRVIGVTQALPANTHIAFEVMAGLQTMQLAGTGISQAFESDWGRTFSGLHYIKMKQGAEASTFIPAAAGLIDRTFKQSSPPDLTRTTYSWSLVPLLASHLAGPDVITFPTGTAQPGDLKMLWTLGIAAIALMVISGFNYVTLSLARNLRRRREVAMRKVLGAGKPAIVRHYMFESAMLTAVALALGFGLAELLHPWFARGIGQPETMFALYKPEFLAWSALAYVALVLTVGAYPALYLGSVRPQTGLGEDPAPMPGALGRFVSSGLLGVQLAAAAGLVIVSVTMMAQANFLSNRFMGFEVKDRYEVSMRCLGTPMGDGNFRFSSGMMRECDAKANALLARTPGVENVFHGGGGVLATNDLRPVGRSYDGEGIGSAVGMSVDTDFLQGMGTRLLAGRYLDGNSAYDRSMIDWEKQRDAMGAGYTGPRPPERLPVVVSRAMLPVLGVSTPEEAIGQQFALRRMQGDPERDPINEVVGVIEDWHQRPLKFEVSPMVFIPKTPRGMMLETRSENVDSVLQALRTGWREATGDPSATVSMTSLREKFSRAYQADFQLMYALLGFAIVAIAVAGMGVYGLSAFEMRRRVREIGIRKALGATPGNVTSMVIGRALVFAGIATVIAWPVGWWLAEQWLSSFVYRTSLTFAVLPAATLAVIILVGIAVTLNALRAAAVRPNIALRTTG